LGCAVWTIRPAGDPLAGAHSTLSPGSKSRQVFGHARAHSCASTTRPVAQNHRALLQVRAQYQEIISPLEYVTIVAYGFYSGSKSPIRRTGRIRDDPAMRFQDVQARKKKERRRGTAAVELALVLPFLIFLTMATVDFARVAFVQVTLQNCARNGALYEFNTQASLPVPSAWTSLSEAVQADAGSLTVTATATSPESSSNNSVTVTATATYTLIAFPSLRGFSSIPSSVTLSQSATMPYPASASPVP
jgi:Flp pilus assembly protein TadG